MAVVDIDPVDNAFGEVGDIRSYVKRIHDDGAIEYARVGIEEISTRGRFGMSSYSYSPQELTVGNKTFWLTDESQIKVGDDVLITHVYQKEFYMWGEVTNKVNNAFESYLEIFIEDVSEIYIENLSGWDIQVVARPKPGIEKDVSFSTVDPTDAGPFTFEITSGKFFPLGGQLLIKPNEDRTVALLGRVLSYEGTTLIVAKNETNATVPTDYDSWNIALLDAPPADMPFRSIDGLTIEAETGTGVMTVSAGSVMDSTGSILLTLPATVTKELDEYFVEGTGEGSQVRVLISGTVTSSGDILTGTGTAFTTELVESGVPAVYLDDYLASGGLTESWFGSLATGSMISYGTDTDVSSISTITNNTTLDVGNPPGVTADTIYRGGALNTAAGSDFGDWYVLIIRRDSDGYIDICTCTATPSGEPDLPAGYTYYRCIGRIFQSIDDSFRPVQHLYENNYPFAPNDATYLVISAAGDTRLKNEHILTSGNHTSISTTAAPLVRVNLNSGAITNQTEKTTLVDDDLFLIADSEASFALKKVKNINAGGGGGGGGIPTDWGLITDVVTDTLDFGSLT